MRASEILSSEASEVLANLWELDAQQRQHHDRGPDSLKAVHPSVAELLHVLILQKQANTIVEFGTSHGLSTIWLADAARRTGGHVYSVDAMPSKTSSAKDNLRSAGLADQVTLTSADGVDFAKTLPDGIDFVFVDFGLPAFLPAFERLKPKMAVGAALFVDGGPEGHWQEQPNLDCLRQLEAERGLVLIRLPMVKEHLLAVVVETAEPGTCGVTATSG